MSKKSIMLFLVLMYLGLKSANSLHAPDFMRVCYFTNWSCDLLVPEAHFCLRHVDASLCSHIIYGFVDINVTSLSLTPSRVDDESKDGVVGRYILFNDLKKTHPRLKTLLSVGGSHQSEGLRAVTASPTSRMEFAVNSVAYVRRWGFDGLDLDWEYPGQDGDEDGKRSLTLLIEDIRQADRLQTSPTKAPPLVLSVAGPASEALVDRGFLVPNISRQVDFINLMAYDLQGSWSHVTGFNSPLYPRTNDSRFTPELCVEWVVNMWLRKGAPASKLVLGIAGYGQTYTLANSTDPMVTMTVNTSATTAVHSNSSDLTTVNGSSVEESALPTHTSPSKSSSSSPTTTSSGTEHPGPGSRAVGPGRTGRLRHLSGQLSFPEICELIERGGHVSYDEQQQVPYMTFGDLWVGYDDRRSVTEKVTWAHNLGLGGVMFWSLDLDDFKGDYCKMGPYPLLTALSNAVTSLVAMENELDDRIARRHRLMTLKGPAGKPDNSSREENNNNSNIIRNRNRNLPRNEKVHESEDSTHITYSRNSIHYSTENKDKSKKNIISNSRRSSSRSTSRSNNDRSNNKSKSGSSTRRGSYGKNRARETHTRRWDASSTSTRRNHGNTTRATTQIRNRHNRVRGRTDRNDKDSERVIGHRGNRPGEKRTDSIRSHHQKSSIDKTDGNNGNNSSINNNKQYTIPGSNEKVRADYDDNNSANITGSDNKNKRNNDNVLENFGQSRSSEQHESLPSSTTASDREDKTTQRNITLPYRRHSSPAPTSGSESIHILSNPQSALKFNTLPTSTITEEYGRRHNESRRTDNNGYSSTVPEIPGTHNSTDYEDGDAYLFETSTAPNNAQPPFESRNATYNTSPASYEFDDMSLDDTSHDPFAFYYLAFKLPGSDTTMQTSPVAQTPPGAEHTDKNTKSDEIGKLKESGLAASVSGSHSMLIQMSGACLYVVFVIVAFVLTSIIT